ncbi:TonB-dependent receptor domain-containing protein [Endozoicomonas ascidiicola]|uniref:TonB-dependent receptor domain-containing protein n=1 Tax=Endozoicomonas ascidiicola TaxID=1698521 RepID=UPI00082AE4D7|nr:TonB-dependent receptor [Endozoicomonas ascidiicola]
MKYFSFSPVLTSLALVICSTTALATEPKAYTMDRVVVSATRTAQSVDETLAPVSVITREDIERSQASSVPELLRTVPGVQFVSNGGRGSTTSMLIRGSSSEQTLVIVDGQRINGATNGTPELQYLDPNQIERIEIVRGPVSSLYGADAIGGVVNISTRKGTGKPQLAIKVSTGTDNTKELGLNFGGQSGSTRFNIGTNFAKTDGYDFTNDLSSGHKGLNHDDDGFKNSAFSASVSHEFSNETEAGLSFSHVDGKVEYDSTTKVGTSYLPYDVYNEFKNTTINAYIKKSLTDTWFTRFDVGYIRNNSKHNGDNLPAGHKYKPSEYETNRYSLLWQNDISWQDSQLLTLGVDYYLDKIDGHGNYTDPRTGKKEDSRYNAALFVQNQSQFDNSDLQIALRQDENEIYGSKTTGNIAYGYALSNEVRLIGSFGTAFRAPTFNNLYYPDNTNYIGNPDVKPEKSQNVELALKGNHSFGRWEIAAFQNDIDDMIDWEYVNPNLGSGPKRATNIDEAKIQGIEASIQTIIMDWSINSTLTLLNPKNEKTDTYLARRARQAYSLSADRSVGSWSIGGTVFAQGKSYNSDANKDTDELSGFATIDLRMAKQLNNQFKSELKLTNLMDKEYSTVKGYNAPPRAGIVSLTWTPEF